MQSSPKTISDTDIALLLSHCQHASHRAIISLLVDTGLRVSELTALRQDDLWLSGDAVTQLDVRAEIAKTKQPRSIPMTPRAMAAIRDLRKDLWLSAPGCHSTAAFPGRNAVTALTARTIQRIVLSYGWQALRRRVTPHMLRHTFATRLMRKTNIRVVQQLLGHKSLNSTQIYTHPNTQDLKEAIGNLDATT